MLFYEDQFEPVTEADISVLKVCEECGGSFHTSEDSDICEGCLECDYSHCPPVSPSAFHSHKREKLIP